ncbi:hypothetical protein GCM10022415_20180 [Knoellia locipacati]|uniref:Uncharacterized protein n=1 Tax=Knoellia locipacati TaxID=882824 RepID=A0A512T187_9MICO|nr:hypothetical protein [Knoellia locipacati]GEQ13966.1 hypothetical protein KLO01_20130 [Knoellia locipacati]
MVWIVVGIVVAIGLLGWYLSRRDSSSRGQVASHSSVDAQAPFRQEGNGGGLGGGSFTGGGNT